MNDETDDIVSLMTMRHSGIRSLCGTRAQQQLHEKKIYPLLCQCNKPEAQWRAEANAKFQTRLNRGVTGHMLQLLDQEHHIERLFQTPILRKWCDAASQDGIESLSSIVDSMEEFVEFGSARRASVLSIITAGKGIRSFPHPQFMLLKIHQSHSSVHFLDHMVWFCIGSQPGSGKLFPTIRKSETSLAVPKKTMAQVQRSSSRRIRLSVDQRFSRGIIGGTISMCNDDNPVAGGGDPKASLNGKSVSTSGVKLTEDTEEAASSAVKSSLDEKAKDTPKAALEKNK